MRVIRILPVGLLVTVGVGVGCGAEPSSPTESSAELQMPKASSFESLVSVENKVTDTGEGGTKKDGNLLNAWGLAFDPQTGFIWIAANGTGSAQVFNEDGVLQKPVALAPAAPDPTGAIFNPTSGFNGDDFIFASESGTVVGVKRGDTAAPTMAPFSATDGAVYKGIALAFFRGKPFLFLTDFHNGKIDVLDANYNKVDTTGRFIDRNIPMGFAPFNIIAAGDDLIVSYARQDDTQHDDVPGNGNGFVDIFDTSGAFDQRLLSGPQHSELSSPWGMALSFSREKGEGKSLDLLIGNFGDPDVDNVDVSGHINVYDLTMIGRHLRASFEGPLGVNPSARAPLVIHGLWGFKFGNGKGGFDPGDIYFTAGPGGEEHGLFGELEFITPRR